MTDPLEGEPGTEDDVIDKVKYPRPIIGCKSSERRHAGVDDFLYEEFTEKCSTSVCGINLIFFGHISWLVFNRRVEQAAF
jgi:hypothetical protein